MENVENSNANRIDLVKMVYCRKKRQDIGLSQMSNKQINERL